VFIVQVVRPRWNGRHVDFVDFDDFDLPRDGHVIVSGDDALATTIVKELTRAGANVVQLAGTELADAGVAGALAVVCAGEDDAINLEIALLARNETPWFCRRLGLLDSDQGLVGPLCIVERGFEFGRRNVGEVAV
jgi:hypothetical protein